MGRSPAWVRYPTTKRAGRGLGLEPAPQLGVQITRSLAIGLASVDFRCISLHPVWVRTEIGGAGEALPW